MNRYAIIVAGGSGSRFGGKIPKQFLEIGGMPVVYYPLSVFDSLAEIILVLPEEHISLWKEICTKRSIRISHSIVPGGPTRADSVRSGLGMIPADEGLVAVHDAVRPLVSEKLARQAFDEAARHRAAVPVIHVDDTIRDLTADSSKVLDRCHLKLVQTPQVFELELLREAYSKGPGSPFTDDAAYVEALGVKVHYFKGEAANLKITREEDLRIAEALIRSMP